jgi:hypothetical protein
MMQREGFSISDACQTTQVSRAGFYRAFTAHAHAKRMSRYALPYKP